MVQKVFGIRETKNGTEASVSVDENKWAPKNLVPAKETKNWRKEENYEKGSSEAFKQVCNGRFNCTKRDCGTWQR